MGESVRFGYYSQQGLEFDPEKKVIDIVTDIAHETPSERRSEDECLAISAIFSLPAETQYGFVSRLSGGERKRLYLCTILMQNPNFLVLDEPTNDLDIVTLACWRSTCRHSKGV